MNYLNQPLNLFPFQVYFNDGKAYVAKNYSGINSIRAGDEILNIKGKSINKIKEYLLTLIPSDGYNQTMKFRALYLQFPGWYRMIDLTENFTVVTKQNNIENTYQIKGAKFNDIAKNGFLKETERDKPLEFRIENRIGFRTIHSFAQSDIKKSKQKFKEFINQAFIELKKNKIENPVVDLRDNTGGSDANAAYFTSFFFEKPFRYWHRIEVTEAVAMK